MSRSVPRFGTAHSNMLLALVLTLFSAGTWQFIHATTTLRVDPWYPPSPYDRSDDKLVEDCPNPLGKLSRECRETMNDYFEELPLEEVATTWILISNRLTFGRAFQDPIGDRKRVFDALQQKECRLEEGDTVRWDLSESCHADAFANLSIFLWACSRFSDLESLPPSGYDLNYYADFEDSDPQEFRKILRAQVVSNLEARWLNSKCAHYKESETRIDPLLDQEPYQALHSTGKRLGDWWPEYSQVPESFVLKSLAARLGDKSAAVLYDGPSHAQTGDSWSTYMGEEWPWKRLNRAFQEYTHKLDDWRVETIERLQMGISLAVSFQESGLEFDWNYLVRRVCTLESSEEATCKTAIEELDPTYKWDQESELKALEEFKKVSRELNLYD